MTYLKFIKLINYCKVLTSPQVPSETMVTVFIDVSVKPTVFYE